MARIGFSFLNVGDKVDVAYLSSRRAGTDAYIVNDLTVVERDAERVLFDDDTEVYRFNKRWSYGTSADPARIVKLH